MKVTEREKQARNLAFFQGISWAFTIVSTIAFSKSALGDKNITIPLIALIVSGTALAVATILEEKREAVD